MKFQAVLFEGWGIPGVSGDEKVQQPAAPGAIFGVIAKLAGEVPSAEVDGLAPRGGNE